MSKGLARIPLTLGSQCEKMKAAALQTHAKSLRNHGLIVFSGLAQSAFGSTADITNIRLVPLAEIRIEAFRSKVQYL